MYHGICAGEVEPALFAWQLGVLRNEFELVSLPELLARRSAGSLTGDEAVITFDDGVRNHATVAYPILREHRAPATFFVCPGLMDSGEWIWTQELRCRLHLLPAAALAALCARIGGASPDIEDLVRRAKGLKLGERLEAEAWVRSRTQEFSPTESESARFAPMSWEQVLGFDQNLITIGSHTLRHANLSSLSSEDQRTELSGSRRLLEQRLGRSVDLFCYPNGDTGTGARVWVREHYAAAVTGCAGAVTEADDAWLLPRIPAGETRGLFVRRLYRHHS